MKTNLFFRVLALLLALMLLALPAAAEWMEVSLTGWGDGLRLEAGLDAQENPGFVMSIGDETLVLSAEGIRLDEGEESIGFTWDALGEAFWLEVLGVSHLPSNTDEDAAVLGGMLAQLWQEATANAFTVEQTQQEGSLETTYTLRLKSLLTDVDKAVQTLLSEYGSQVDALIVKYAELLETVLGIPSQELSSATLLAAWKQLGVSKLLPMELPLIFKVESSGGFADPWTAMALLPAVVAELSWTGANVEARLIIGAEIYTFDSRDFEWLLTLMAKAFESLPADALLYEKSSYSNVSYVRLHLNQAELLNAFTYALGALLNGEAEQTQAFLKRYIPWMELLGLDMEGLSCETLVKGLLDYNAYSGMGYRQRYMDDPSMASDIDFSLRYDRFRTLPFALEASAFGYSFSLSVDEDRLNAEIDAGDEGRCVLSGWIDEDGMGEAMLSTGSDVYRLTLTAEGDSLARFELKANNAVILTGTLSANSLLFETANGAYGSLSITDNEARLNLWDGSRFSTAALRLVAEAWQLDIDAFGQQLHFRLSPEQFAFSGPFDLELRALPRGAYGHIKAVGLNAALEVTSDGVHLTYDQANKGFNELRCTQDMLLLTWLGKTQMHKLLMTVVEPAPSQIFAMKINYNNVVKELYNGLFTVTELTNGLMLGLTSEAHDPITCTLRAFDWPFVIPSLEDAQLLSPQQIRQMLF